MKFSELPQNTQNDLIDQQHNLYKSWYTNNSRHITFTNKEGTRYFTAHRKSLSGKYSSFDGGSQWIIKYGKVGWSSYTDPMGGTKYEMCKSNRVLFGKSTNGTIIPKTVNTKKEVLEIAKNIGTLIIDKIWD